MIRRGWASRVKTHLSVNVKTFITLAIVLFTLTAGAIIWHNQTIPRNSTTLGLSASSPLPALPHYSDNSTATSPSKTIPLAKDDSELDLAITGNASMLLTDSAGRRTGFDPAPRRQLQEVPNSAYFEDSIAGEVSRSLEISQPQEGPYQLVITASAEGSSQLSIRAFSRNGDPQPELLKKGNLTKGSRAKFNLKFTSTPGEISTLK